jgi:hypothetical protein
MSSTSSAGSADLALASNGPDSEPLPFANESHSADRFSPSGGPTCPAMRTFASSRPIVLKQMEFPWMPSAEDSPAKTYPPQARKSVCPASEAASGSSTRASSAKSDPFSQSLRTCLAFELSGLTECSLTWKNSGTPQNRSWWVLSMPARPMNASGLGLLPTPTASNYGSNQGGQAGRVGPKRHSLRSMARHGLWPTPTANRWSGLQSHGRNAILGTLNPTWVEWLMGFPLHWLRTSSERLEMLSSHKSQNSSGGQS